MQNDLFAVLKAQIVDELSMLDELCEALHRRVSWLVAGKISDPYLMEDVFSALALSLHTFYTGCERILVRLVNNLDGGVPKSPDWHQGLLRQTTLTIPGIRGPIISNLGIYEFLSELRGLRHVIRNIYLKQLRRENLLSFGQEAIRLYPQIKQEIVQFMESFEEGANRPH